MGNVQGRVRPESIFAARVRPVAERVLASSIGRYSVAAALTLLALAATLVLEDTLSSTLTIFFFAAIALSAWLGGFGPGLLATGFSTLCLNYFFIPPRRDW